MDWKNKSFKVLSLTESETTILNTLGTSKNVQGMARDTFLSRTGINHVLKGLIAKELIKFEWIGKRRFYLAVTLEQLSQKFQQTLDQIEIANKDRKGARIKISKEDEFVIHVGAKEIIPAYKRIASENKNERICAIQHHRSWSVLVEKISSKQLIEFNEAIKENHIILDGMLNRGAYNAYSEEIRKDPEKHADMIKSIEGRMADYTVFSDEFFNYDSEIWIFKTTTLIINWSEEVAIEITNANMTGFLKDMFEFVKDGGSKLDHNKAMRDLLK